MLMFRGQLLWVMGCEDAEEGDSHECDYTYISTGTAGTDR